VDVVANAEDVGGVGGVPTGGGVAHVRLGGEEKGERYVGGGRGVVDEGVGGVRGGFCAAEGGEELFC
jgi:hypothetical protein